MADHFQPVGIDDLRALQLLTYDAGSVSANLLFREEMLRHIVITIRPALPAGMERETFMAKLARELDLKNPKPGTPREAAQPFSPARQLRA